MGTCIEELREVHKDHIEVQFEMGEWMVELIPKDPFVYFLDIEEMYKHFSYISKAIDGGKTIVNKHVALTSVSVLPHIGTLNYWISSDGQTIPLEKREELNTISRSTTFLDSTISKHTRYTHLLSNLLERKQKKVHIEIPIYKDINTTINHVVLDHVGYGVGSCALQCTYSSIDLNSARFLYDQLGAIAFMFQCISNGSCVVNGKLSDYDNRWPILEHAVDERSPNEIGKIPKSRCSPFSLYISNDKRNRNRNRNRNRYNDLKFVINKKFKRNLKQLFKTKESEFYKDTRLLNHFAYLFVREPLFVSDNDTIDEDKNHTLDFEKIQGSNWNKLRFKPPPSLESNIG